MRRLYLLALIVVVAMGLGLLTGCEPKVKEPPPECQIDDDCKVNYYCSAGKCLRMATTPKERAEGYINRANKLLAASKVDYAEVIKYYNAAQKEVGEPIPGLQFNIGLAYMKMGELQKAQEIFESEMAKDPENAKPVLAMGRLLIQKNRGPEALALYTKFLEAHPNNLEMRTNAATILRGEKRYDDAMVQIRKIFVKDPAHPGAFNNLGLLYLAQDKILLARMVTVNGIQAQENVKKKPDAGLYNNLGLIYLKMGDRDRAVANFRKAHEIDPRQVSANLNLGHIALEYNDFESAISHYEFVISEDPSHREARLGLAECLTGLGKAKKALRIYQDVLKVDPNDVVAAFNIGIVYFDHLKMQTEAHNAFRHFLTLNYPDQKKNEKARFYLQLEVMVEQQEEPPQRQEQMPEDPNAPAQTEEGQPAEQPADGQQTEQPAEQPAAEQPAEKQAEEKPAEQPAEEPAAEKPVEQPAAEPAAEKPAEQPAAEPAAEKPAEQPAAEPAAEKPAEKPAAEPAVEKPAEQPAAEPAAEQPAEQAAEKPAE